MNYYFRTAKRRIARNPGFTLIELMVVLAILAIFSATAILIVRAPLETARTQYLIASVHSLDSLARSRARQGNHSVALVVDREQRKVALKDGRGATVGQALALPGSLEVGRVLGLETQNVPLVSIPYGPFGVSPSYAIELQGRSKVQWLVVFGLTGQAYVIEEESTVHGLISAAKKREPR